MPARTRSHHRLPAPKQCAQRTEAPYWDHQCRSGGGEKSPLLAFITFFYISESCYGSSHPFATACNNPKGSTLVLSS